MWEIAVPSKSTEPSKQRWGSETYETKEAAQLELKTFWKGVKVDMSKFVIREFDVDQ